jgi:hypothetical protein
MPAATTTPAGSPTTTLAGEHMRAILQRGYGSVDVLSAGTIERPEIGDADVLVEVRAAGLDRGTWHLMAGMPYAIRLMGFGVRAPKNPVPGFDVAGVVVAVGADVTRFAPGDAVFGIARGSFAEFAAAPEDKLALKPAKLTFEQAAAVPISGLTALQGLTDTGRLEAGQRVLIIGASGGVGTYAVQIAKALGAEARVFAAPPRSISSDRSAPTTSSTTRPRTSPNAARHTTSSSTSAATRRSRGCAGRSRRTARSSSPGARRVAAGSAASIASFAASLCRRSSGSG